MLLTTLMSKMRGLHKALWDCSGLSNTLPGGIMEGSLKR